MFAFPNVFHFFAHKLARLSAGRFTFTLVFVGSFNCFFFWHNKMVSPLVICLDVEDCVGRSATAMSLSETILWTRLKWICAANNIRPVKELDSESLRVRFPNGDTGDKQP